MKAQFTPPPPDAGHAKDALKCVLYTTKDLATVMLMHEKTVKRWWRKLNVPPLIAGNRSHRWTQRQATRLIERWQKYSAKSRHVQNWRNGKSSAKK
jgi:hypothetical protein